tara:strand:- start:152 stop:349 length:198 start_codon:yes stop_codon:yes gene_type:complete
MKVGDLVMWIQQDHHHGMIGIIVDIENPEESVANRTTYDVQWSDGIIGFELYDSELMALDDVPEW